MKRGWGLGGNRRGSAEVDKRERGHPGGGLQARATSPAAERLQGASWRLPKGNATSGLPPWLGEAALPGGRAWPDATTPPYAVASMEWPAVFLSPLFGGVKKYG